MNTDEFMISVVVVHTLPEEYAKSPHCCLVALYFSDILRKERRYRSRSST